jgi:hypothetical protein
VVEVAFRAEIAFEAVVAALCRTPIAEALVIEVAFRAEIAFEAVVAALCRTPIAASFAMTRVPIPVIFVSPAASPDWITVINAFCCVITCVNPFTMS